MSSTWSDELAAAHSEVLSDIRSKWQQMTGGPSVLDAVKGFAAAVDWTERWIIALVAFEALLLLATLTFRRRAWLQGATFLGAMAVIYNAERLNALAARHWRSFARQPYFDPHGVFISAMVSGPMLLIMFAVLLNYLAAACQLLVDMKRKELLYKSRQRHREEQVAAGGRRPRQPPGADAAAGGGKKRQ